MLRRNPLAILRARAGYKSARAASEPLGVTPMYLLNIERGGCGASPALIARMAEVYRVDVARVRAAILKAQASLWRRKADFARAEMANRPTGTEAQTPEQ